MRLIKILVSITILSGVVIAPNAYAGSLEVGTTSVTWNDTDFVKPKVCSDLNFTWSKDSSRRLGKVAVYNGKGDLVGLKMLIGSAEEVATVRGVCKSDIRGSDSLFITMESSNQFGATAVANTKIKLLSQAQAQKIKLKRYKTCEDLRGSYPLGISRSLQAAQSILYTNTGLLRPSIDAKVYAVNKRLDAQGSGVICAKKDIDQLSSNFGNYYQLGSYIVSLWESDQISWKQTYATANLNLFLTGRTAESRQNICLNGPGPDGIYRRAIVEQLVMFASVTSESDISWLNGNIDKLMNLACADLRYTSTWP